MFKMKEKLSIDCKSLLLETVFITIIAIFFYKSKFIYINKYKISFLAVIIITVLAMNLYTIFKNENSEKDKIISKENGRSFRIVIYFTSVSILINKFMPFNINIWVLYLSNLLLVFVVFKICKTKLSNFNFKTNLFWIALSFIISYFLLSLGLREGRNEYYNIFNFLFVVGLNFISNFGLEEVIYRGCAFNGLSKTKLSYVEINIIQSLLFGISHLGSFGKTMNAIPYYILFGYLFGKVYITSKSLTPVILMHGIFNTY